MISPLTDVQKTGQKGEMLTRSKSFPFVISIEHSLDNKFGFIDMKQGSLKSLHQFIEETVGKGLSISQVDNMFLRTKGKPFRAMEVKGIQTDVYHYGKDRNPFRLFGYYLNSRFVLLRIDCNHKTHPEK